MPIRVGGVGKDNSASSGDDAPAWVERFARLGVVAPIVFRVAILRRANDDGTPTIIKTVIPQPELFAEGFGINIVG